MGLKFKTLWDYEGMFERCYLEPVRDGFSVFDANRDFIGIVYNHGFGFNPDYEHKDQVQIKLANKKINSFDLETFHAIAEEMLLEVD